MIPQLQLGQTGRYEQRTDPNYPSVSLLIQAGQPTASTSVYDQSPRPKAMTAANGCSYSGAVQFNGATTIQFDGVNDALTSASSADLGFGSGDFTIDGFIYPTSSGGDHAIFDNRSASNAGCGLYCSTTALANKLVYANNAAVIANSTNSFALNAWRHFRVCRSGTSVYGFIAGNLEFTVTDSRTFASSAVANIGSNYIPSQWFNGYKAEMRVIKGVALSTASFTAPTVISANS